MRLSKKSVEGSRQEHITHPILKKLNLIIIRLIDAAPKFASSIEPDFCKSRLFVKQFQFPRKFKKTRPTIVVWESHTKPRHCLLIFQSFAQTFQPKAEVSSRSRSTALPQFPPATIPLLVEPSEETEANSQFYH